MSSEPVFCSPDLLQNSDMKPLLSSTTKHLLLRLQQGLSNPPVELVYASHKQWPFPPHPPTGKSTAKSPLRISVLDSSYNPPTLAHLAIARSHRPIYKDGGTNNYDARLLLLSVKNADKTLKPWDATYLQRLEMMALFVEDVIQHQSGSDSSNANIAIAITDEPTFVAKSSKLQLYLKDRFTALSTITPAPDVQLTFLVGFDTLERLFSLKYYGSESDMMKSLRKFLSPSPNGDDSFIICARRVSPQLATKSDALVETRDAEKKLPSLAQEFINSERVVFIDIGDDESKYSSSAVRGAIGQPMTEQDEMWRKWVTGRVAEYINNEKLYIDRS